MDIAHIESDEGTHVAAIPPAYNYACRGLSLRHLSVLEYAMLLVMEKGESKENLRNARFPLHPRHIMAKEWRQQLLSQLRVPILTGKKLPRWPGQEGNPHAQARWAQYVQTLLVPWDIENPPSLSWEDLGKNIQAWSQPGASYLERSRLNLVDRLRRFGQFDKKIAYLATLARQRNRKLWGVAHPLDINFDARGEMAALRAMRDVDHHAEFIRRMEGIKQAIEKEIDRGVTFVDAAPSTYVEQALSSLFPISFGEDQNLQVAEEHILTTDDINPFDPRASIHDHIKTIHAAIRQEVVDPPVPPPWSSHRWQVCMRQQPPRC